MTSMFERLAGTPCAGCVHMVWDLFYDEPCGMCMLKVRNRYGAWKPAASKCRKLGFEFYEQEEWKAEKAKAFFKGRGSRIVDRGNAATVPEKKNGCIFPETAVSAHAS